MVRRLALVVAFLATLVICGLVQAEDGRRDGNWWRQQSDPEKAAYMTGFFDGMALGANFSWWGLPEEGDERKSISAKISESYQTQKDKYLAHVTNIQISDGLTVFYEDYRNRTIEIWKAVWLVLNTISGKSPAEIEKMTENFRKHAPDDK